MDEDLSGYKDDDRWVALAANVEPLELCAQPGPVRRRPRNKEAHRALALAILGMMGFGLLVSPLALALGQRARMALAVEPDFRDTRVAHLAVTIGKVGLALYLAIAFTVIPWVLFVLPLSGG
jgi:hypothetical protein